MADKAIEPGKKSTERYLPEAEKKKLMIRRKEKVEKENSL